MTAALVFGTMRAEGGAALWTERVPGLFSHVLDRQWCHTKATWPAESSGLCSSGNDVAETRPISTFDHLKMPEMRLVLRRTRENMLTLKGSADMEACRKLA